MQTGFGASLVKARLVLTLASLIVSYQTCVILYAVAYRAKNCWALASPFHGTLQIGKRNVIILEFLSGVGVKEAKTCGGFRLQTPPPLPATSLPLCLMLWILTYSLHCYTMLSPSQLMVIGWRVALSLFNSLFIPSFFVLFLYDHYSLR